MSTVHIRSEDGVAVFGAAKRHLEEYGCHHRSFYAGCSSCELRKELDKVGISIPPKEYPNHEVLHLDRMEKYPIQVLALLWRDGWGNLDWIERYAIVKGLTNGSFTEVTELVEA